MSIVIAISGQIGAGKSTLAAGLSDRLNWPTASFGQYVRMQARERGLDEDRDVLQELGERLIRELGWPELCRRVLASVGVGPGGAPCVVEGVRHVAALDTLRELFAPVPVRLVHVAASSEVRSARLADQGIERSHVTALDEHSTERDVKRALPELADITVLGDDDPVDSVVRWLNGLDARH